MAMSPMTFDGMMGAPGYRNLARGRAIQKAEGHVLNEVSAKGTGTCECQRDTWDWQKVGNSGKPEDTRN
jgi:hypothetical protein